MNENKPKADAKSPPAPAGKATPPAPEKDFNPSEELAVRRQKLADLRARGIDPYPPRFNLKPTLATDQVLIKYADLQGEAKSPGKVTLAGRLVGRRGHGKAMFANILDGGGRIQIYAKIDILGEAAFADFEKLDLGDFIAVQGEVFRTHRGELTLSVEKYEFLAKSLHPLPEKFHGLVDKETRYRQRYADLIANPQVKETFKTRSRVINLIKKYLDEKGFLEVDTPVLHDIAEGAAAQPFVTYHRAHDSTLYLRIALELHLKRLIVGGFDKVYEMGRVFRNEGLSWKHNPEYTLLELYQAYADYHDMMDLTEDLICRLVKELTGGDRLNYQGQELNFAKPWARLTMQEVTKKYTGMDILNSDIKDLAAYAKSQGIELAYTHNRGAIVETIYEKMVEPNLIQPTFIYDYLVETSPLAKNKPDDPRLVERFELIINGMEIANAFSELNDPIEQRKRFKEQNTSQIEGGTSPIKSNEPSTLKEAAKKPRLDEDFITALEYGMPPTGGLGIGIDRLVMLLTDAHSIRDVLLFPHLRPISTGTAETV